MDNLTPIFIRRPLIFSLLLGALIGTGFEPINFLIGPFIGMGFFFHILFVKLPCNTYTTKQIFAFGWMFGIGYFVTGLYWTACALHVQFSQLWPLIPIAVIGIPAVCALIPALTSAITYHLNFDNKFLKSNCFILVWMLLEWIRGHYIAAGFPWLMLGDIWISILPFAQLFSVLGNYGITLITLCLILILTVKPYVRNFVIFSIFVIIWYSWGLNRLQTMTIFDQSFRVTLIQPNIKQIDKWRPNIIRENLDHLVAATHVDKIDNLPMVTILPESAITYRLNLEQSLSKYITRNLAADSYLITGATRADINRDLKLYNSLYVLDPNGQILSYYDKVHLTPFGEYIPLRNIFSGLIKNIVGNQIDFSFGTSQKPYRLPNIPPFLPLICYEGIFLDEVSDSKSFKWIINITNDGWFLNSSGPYQHFAMIRACAIAWGTPVVRVANTGISAIIDGHGRIVSHLNYGQKGKLTGYIPNQLSHKTLFAQYGNQFFWLMYGILILISLFIWYRVTKYD